jgi:hypothetical protein
MVMLPLDYPECPFQWMRWLFGPFNKHKITPFSFSFLIILDDNKVLLSWVIKLLAIYLHQLYLVVKILIFRVSDPISLKLDLSFSDSPTNTPLSPASSLFTAASSFRPAFQPSPPLV